MKRSLLVACIFTCQAAFAQDALRVSSDRTVGGFVFPESCGYEQLEEPVSYDLGEVLSG